MTLESAREYTEWSTAKPEGSAASLPFFDYVDFARLPDEFDRLSHEPRTGSQA